MIRTFILLMLLSLNLSAKSVTLNDQNTMSLNGPVDGVSMTTLMVKLQELNKIDTKEPIYLVINSPGGSVYDGFDFIRFAQTSKRKIHTVTLFAASMGFQIVESLGDRYVTSYSSLMSHRVRGGFNNVEMPGQLDSRYAHLISHILEQDNLVVSRTKGKQTLSSYVSLIQNEYWANSSRAIKDGFADEEVTVSCDKSLEGNVEQEIDLGMISVNAVFSKCPLITSPISVSINRGAKYASENNLNPRQEFNKVFSIKNIQY